MNDKVQFYSIVPQDDGRYAVVTAGVKLFVGSVEQCDDVRRNLSELNGPARWQWIYSRPLDFWKTDVTAS